MRHIRQGDDTDDCGIACVAMLAGVELNEAREAFRIDVSSGTTPNQVLQALLLFGVEMPSTATVKRPIDQTYRRRSSLERQLSDLLKRDALLKLVRKDHKGGRWHWVVWDAARKRILDPWQPGESRLARITSYREVTRRRFGELVT